MSDSDHPVGYRRPPKHSQFKKGASGNPAGRPPKQTGTVVTEILDAPVTIQKKGRVQAVSGFEAGVRKLIAHAISKQDLSACLKALKLFEEYGILTPSPPPPAVSPVLEIPKHWDHDEWMDMFLRYGPPPWGGPRSGLTKEEEEQRSKKWRGE